MNMNTCDTYNAADWHEFAKGGVRQRSRDRMRRHLRNCPHCRELYEDVDALDDLLGQASDERSTDLPQQTEKQILDTARKEARRRRSESSRPRTDDREESRPDRAFAWNEFLFGAASAAAVLLGAYVLLEPVLRPTGLRRHAASRYNQPADERVMGRDRAERSTGTAGKGKRSDGRETDQTTNENGSAPPSDDPDSSGETNGPKTPEANGSTTKNTDPRPGDANGDGRVNVVDSMLITRAVMNDRETDVTSMDVNRDGQVTLEDARRIMKKSLRRTADVDPRQKTF